MAFLLLSLAALNMPQTTVLCIGYDGHMAIEPAGHSHCADGSHTHDRGPDGSKEQEHSHIGRDCCRPCIDIPIPSGAGDERVVSQRSRPAPATLAVFQPALQTPGLLEAPGSTESISSWLSPPCGISLCCVILQV